MPNQWMPREKWNSLILGEGCPLCANIKAPGADNDYNYFIADLSVSRLVMDKNQYVKGYSLLICHKHVREPYELPQDEQEMFFADMMASGLALEKAFGSDKMNFQILGNAVPHLHCHLEPRYYGDPAPGHPIDPNAETVILTQEEYKARIKIVRDALDLIQSKR